MITIGRVGVWVCSPTKLKKRVKNKPKAEQETAQPTAARFNKQTKNSRNLLSLPPLPDGGGHWGSLNTAIPQKGSANTAIPQKKSQNTTILQYRVENVIPRPLFCMLKFRANKTEITTKNLLMNVRSGNFWFKQSQ